MSESSEPKIKFHYLKANGYRVVHLDGAHGGLTPRGQVFVAVYSERQPIPEMAVYRIDPGGILGDEIQEERKTKGGVVREVEVGLTMDLAAAESLHRWLGTKVDELKAVLSKAKNTQD